MKHTPKTTTAEPLSIDDLATPETTGLAIALHAESNDEMPLLLCAGNLDTSPIFRACVEDYGVDEKAIAALRSGFTGDDDTFAVRQFGARLYRAGWAACEIAMKNQSTAN